jgi:O-antigen ligase
MSARTAHSLPSGIAISRDAVRLWGALVVAGLATLVAARISLSGFIVMAAILLAVFAYVSYRAPRAMLLLMVLAPLVDRYIVRQTLPLNLQVYGDVASEGLLVIVGIAILIHGARTGRLLPAIRHPMTVLMVAFGVVALLSTIVNHVGLEVAGLGTLFTVDAFVLFFLVRVIGFDEREATLAAGAFVAVAVLAALLALGQVVITPDFLGLTTWTGRFGEGLRPGSIFIGQPNMLGAVVAIALPFAAFPVARPELGIRLRAVCLVAALILGVTLVFTFSRGTWLAIAIAVTIVGLVAERRGFVFVALIGAASLAIAIALPRGILLPSNSQWSIDLGNATFGRVGAIAEGRDQRFQFMENALPILRDHPVVGSGPGTYGGGVAADFGSPYYSRYTDGAVPTGRTVDNYWLHVVVEFGVGGAVLLFGMLGWAVLEMLRAIRLSTGRRRALLAAVATSTTILAIASGTEMLLEGNTTSFVLWFFIGVASLLAAPMVVTLDVAEQPPDSTQRTSGSGDGVNVDASVPERITAGS